VDYGECRRASGGKTVKHLAPLIVLALLAQPAAGAERLGRLFFTPEERAALDTARIKKTPPPVASADAPQAAPPPEVVTYGGLVRRSDGKTTVWLNNRAMNDKDTAAGSISGKVRPDGRVTVQSPQTGRNVDLKVGQTAELLSGTVEEGYRRGAAPKPESKSESRTEPKPAAKPAAEASTASPPSSERPRDDKDREDRMEKAVRALEDAANAKSGAAPGQPPQERTR
jgi:hypothetical protein